MIHCGFVWHWYGLVWYIVVWCGLVWCIVVWYGIGWWGVVHCGLVLYWYGGVCYIVGWFGLVWYGRDIWYGVVETIRGNAKHFSLPVGTKSALRIVTELWTAGYFHPAAVGEWWTLVH